MPKKTLIAFFTKGGAAGDYARVVSESLRAKGHEVDLVDLRRERRPDLAPYSTVVFGTGVRIGRVYRRGRRFLRRPELKEKRLAVFLASGIAVDDPAESKRRFLDPLIRKYGLTPVLCDALPGKIPGPNGELEDRTDARRARAWAEELAERLAGPEGDHE